MSQKWKSYSEFKIFCYLLLGDIGDISTIERESCQFPDLSRLFLIPTYNGNISVIFCQANWMVFGAALPNGFKTLTKYLVFSFKSVFGWLILLVLMTLCLCHCNIVKWCVMETPGQRPYSCIFIYCKTKNPLFVGGRPAKSPKISTN